jgi:hypothetical protein
MYKGTDVGSAATAFYKEMISFAFTSTSVRRIHLSAQYRGRARWNASFPHSSTLPYVTSIYQAIMDSDSMFETGYFNLMHNGERLIPGFVARMPETAMQDGVVLEIVPHSYQLERALEGF